METKIEVTVLTSTSIGIGDSKKLLTTMLKDMNVKSYKLLDSQDTWRLAYEINGEEYSHRICYEAVFNGKGYRDAANELASKLNKESKVLRHLIMHQPTK